MGCFGGMRDFILDGDDIGMLVDHSAKDFVQEGKDVFQIWDMREMVKVWEVSA